MQSRGRGSAGRTMRGSLGAGWFVGLALAAGCGEDDGPLCTGNECVCGAGRTCEPRCTEIDDCSIDCRADSTCTADCANASSSCGVQCGAGSTCATLCARSAVCTVQCTEAADCRVDCGTAATCDVQCPAASCGVQHCQPGRNCTVVCGAGGPPTPSGTGVICG